MEVEGLTGKLFKNTFLGIFFKLLIIAFTFINRTLFIHVLGEQYLGINGLYSNILSVLSLADLGVNSVLMFFLYEPLVHNDERMLSTLISYFRKIYYLIAGVVFGVGICLIPFLPHLVNETFLNGTQLVFYYLLFLLNTSFSYLAVYKSTMLIADQCAYIVNTVNFAFTIIQSLLQIGILYFTDNYSFYLLAIIVCTIANNIVLTFISNRKYPFLNKYSTKNNIDYLKRKIFDSIKNVFLYRVGGTIMNSTDNILISILLGTTIVGYYSNYVLIISSLTTLLMFFSQAMMTSMGNFSVDANSIKKETIFRSSMLIYAFIAAFATSCILCMMNDFMIVWLKNEQYILSNVFVWVLGFKLFVDIITSPNWTFRESVGLFKEVRYIMFLAAILNILLSVILSKPFGLSGIILATSISKIATLFWYEPRIFYKKVFNKSLSTYWHYNFKLIIVSFICIGISYFISMFIPLTLFGMIIKIIIAALSTLSIFILTLRKSKEFKFCIIKITGLLKTITKLK